MTSPPERRQAERLLERIRTRVAELRRLEQTRARTAANSNSDNARSPTAMGSSRASSTNSPAAATYAAGPTRARATARAANWAFSWTVAFIALHVYWYLGGRVGFGDQADPLPGWPSSVGGWIVEVLVDGMWVAGLVVPSALAWPWGRRLPRRMLVAMMWTGGAILVARGGLGLVDDALRFSGLLDGGLTGLSTKDVLGSADPSTYTKLSTVAIDSIFLLGGLLFGHAARLAQSAVRTPDASSAMVRETTAREAERCLTSL
jgi:hypothetical protein